jgi:hypothetical protein
MGALLLSLGTFVLSLALLRLEPAEALKRGAPAGLLAVGGLSMLGRARLPRNRSPLPLMGGVMVAAFLAAWATAHG